MTALAVAQLDDRQAWLEWRRAGIGSSDAPAIANLDPYRGPLAVWLEKSGKIALDREESEYQRWGRLLEDAICKEFETRTGLFVPPGTRQLAIEHADKAWFRATVDGFVHDEPQPRSFALGVLEVKTVAGFKSDAWTVTSENPNGVPDHFRVQVLHQLGVTDTRHAWIAVLFGGQRLEIRELERDDDELAALLDLAGAFWARGLSGIPPAGDGTAGSTEALRAAYAGGGEAISLPVEAGPILIEREQAKAEEKAASARAAAAEQSVMSMLGDAEIGLYDGRRRVTWKSSKRSGIDLDALREKHPDIARQLATSTSLRTLRFVGSIADTGGES